MRSDVELDAEEAEPRADALADERGVLPDTRREDERVEAAGRDSHRGDRAGNAIGEDLEREPRALVSGAGTVLQLAHVARSRRGP